ncbi:MAG: helix-turn-helix domain-containing protein [Paucibacter sp.]|nr:helix-turn-helix domain-containing protein [Roseateles sp.]
MSELNRSSPSDLKVACSGCNLRELCLPFALSEADVERLDNIVSLRKNVARGQALFRHDAPFLGLYAVRTGFFKTSVPTGDGRDQVTGFQMAGEVLGLDGLGQERHACDAIALEDSQVCVIPYERMEDLSREFAGLQKQFLKIMSREIVRENSVMLLLGSMKADERVAAFLLNLTKRLQARGFSSSSVLLRMKREEIGSYLGLKLETISRAFSKLQEDGLIVVDQREIEIRDTAGLQRLVNSANC